MEKGYMVSKLFLLKDFSFKKKKKSDKFTGAHRPQDLSEATSYSFLDSLILIIQQNLEIPNIFTHILPTDFQQMWEFQ